MATAAYQADSPSRLLKRVQQLELEDMELPSLPTFQHDNDYDSIAETSADTSNLSDGEDLAYPQPRRNTYSAPTMDEMSRSDISSSPLNSPYPPLNRANQTPSPYEPTTAVTSTPLTAQPKHRSSSVDTETLPTLVRGNIDSSRRTTTGSTRLGSSTNTGRERWHTPGELSRSFSGSEILSPAKRIAVSSSSSASSQNIFMTETPLPRRSAATNMILDHRQSRKSATATPTVETGLDIAAPHPDNVINEQAGQSVEPPLGDQNRIPSLTRSDESVSDTSAAASTPEGPSRNPYVATPQSHRNRASNGPHTNNLHDPASPLSDSYDQTSADFESEAHDHFTAPSLGSLMQDSPAKPEPISQYSTPGIGRLESRHASPSDFMPTPRASNILQDITLDHQDSVAIPFTPTASKDTPSKLSDLSTPRAPLSDSERRKNHVLAVLSSTVPTRTWRAAVRGTPHPLRRVSTAQMSSSMSADNISLGEEKLPGPSSTANSSRMQEMTYDQSFASIASSADLTSDRRATTHKSGLSRGNTSFPTILLPTNASPAGHASLRGMSDQRADGIKIHKHLNAMNKQLLAANSDLAREVDVWREEVDRLHAILEQAGMEVEKRDVESNHPSNQSSGDISRRKDMPSTEMGDQLETLKAEVGEKDQIIAELQEALDAAREDHLARDPDNEQAQATIDELNRQLDEAEQTKSQLQSGFAAKTEQHAKQFEEICAGFEKQVQSLEKDLTQAKEEIAHLQDDREKLENMVHGNETQRENGERERYAALEAELARAREACRQKADEVEELRRQVEDEVNDKRSLLDRLETAEVENNDLLTKVEAAETAAAEIDDIRAQLDEMNQTRANASTEEEFRELQRMNQELEEDLAEREEQLRELSDRLQQLESDLEAAERDDKEAEQQLMNEVDRLNEMVESSNEELAHKDAELEALRAKHNGATPAKQDTEALEVMEGHLEEAFREIGRLKQHLASTPHLKSTLEVREARIQSLEREKAALLDRIASMRESTPFGVQNAVSPFKATPFVHKAIASLRMPKTPGSLQELSWMQSTISDANEPILRAQLEQLQDQLEKANGQLDTNFSRLENAGMSGVRLAEELAIAQDRVAELEDELRALSQRNKASLALVSAQRDETSHEGDVRLKRSLEAVHKQMEALQADARTERKRLQKENERLASVVSELRRDHKTDLEAVKTESARRFAGIETELRRAESETVLIKKEKDSLNLQLRSFTQKTEDLQRQLSSQTSAYDSLRRRQGQMLSSQDVEDSRRRISELEENLTQAQGETRRVRRLADDRGAALTAAENKVSSLQAERGTVAKELAEFEVELENQRNDSQRFGVQLQLLKSEQEGAKSRHAAEVANAEREARLARDQLRAVERQLDDVRRSKSDLSRWKEAHVCNSRLDSSLDQQRARFKVQSHELAVQIRYLKAKFTRESTFRNALALQKKYLLLLVGGMSLNEQATLKQIASMGFPAPPPPRQKHTLKAAGLVVLSLIRARNAAADWRNERQIKLDAIAAREDRKRISP